MRIFAEKALLPDGWATDIAVQVDKAGRIESVGSGARDAGDHVAGILLPSPVNAHSHAFQRAMAGLTERRGPDQTDSFWTWRQLMFRFLDHLTPDHIEAITAFVQMEMLEAGYATNVEFHYIHHQPGGAPYATLHELSERCVAAAMTSGIGITLLPVLYQYGGCDRRALSPGQIRFGNDIDRFTRLLDGAQAAVATLPRDAGIGVAPHSLRAVGKDGLRDAVGLLPDRPIHMHLAEQTAEVDEVRTAWGQRPVEWAVENLGLSSRWCLIHCTQMQPHETQALAATGAIAGLCPITESSLGDGIFDGINWLNHNGKIAIGSDSNIRISLSEELRTFDYSQRLRDRSRAASASPEKSTGRRLYDAILEGGATAAGRQTGAIAPGQWADLLTLDHTHVDLAHRTGDTILDTYVFAGDDRMVLDVWSAGRHLVHEGRHLRRDTITARFSDTLRELGELL